jgi:hypothetical protein
MFSAIENYIRRSLFAVVLLVYLIVLCLEFDDVHQFLDNVQGASRNDPYLTTTTSCDKCNDTRIHNGHEGTVQYPHNWSGSFQENGESDGLVYDNGKRHQAKSMNGVNSHHMARDGAWVDHLSDFLKCNHKKKLDDSENSYARIPTKETWYVPGYWVKMWSEFWDLFLSRTY